MTQDELNSYIPHKTCQAAYAGVSSQICRQCLFKFWYDIAGFYGDEKVKAQIANHEVSSSLSNGGGDGGLPSSQVGTLDNATAPVPTDPNRKDPVDYD